MNIKIKAFIYVSAWIAAWIAFSSIINAGLLEVNVYSPDDKGMLITFLFTAVIFLGGAISLYKEIFTSDS